MLNKINLKEEHHYFLIVLTVAVIGVLFLITVSNNESAITGSTTYITGMQTGTTTPTPTPTTTPTATPAPQTAEECTKKPIGECNDCCASIPNVIENKNKILAEKTQLGTQTSTQKKQTKITIRRNKKDMILALRSCIKTCTTTPRDPFVNLESTKIIHRWYLDYKGMAAQHVHLLGPAERVHSSGFWKAENFEGMVGLLLDQQLPGTIPVYLIWAPFNEAGYGIQTTRFITNKAELEIILKDPAWKQKVIDTWDPYTVILKDGTTPIGYIAPPTLSKEEASAIFGGRSVKKMMGGMRLNRDSLYTISDTELERLRTGGWILEGNNGVIGWYPAGPVPFKKHVIPGIIQAEDFDNAIGDRLIADYGSEGGDEVAYHDTTLNNAGGQTYRWFESVDVVGIAGKPNEYRVGAVAKDEWMIYTINVLEDGDYNIEAHLSKETSGDLIEAMKLEISPNVGVNPTFEFLANFDVQSTGSWDIFKVMREKNKSGQKEQGVKLKKGQYLLKLTSLRVEDFNIDKIEFIKKV